MISLKTVLIAWSYTESTADSHVAWRFHRRVVGDSPPTIWYFSEYKYQCDGPVAQLWCIIVEWSFREFTFSAHWLVSRSMSSKKDKLLSTAFVGIESYIIGGYTCCLKQKTIYYLADHVKYIARTISAMLVFQFCHNVNVHLENWGGILQQLISKLAVTPT